MCTTLYNSIMDIRIRDVPRELHMAYKLTVTANETSIQEQTLKLIEEYVKREKRVQYDGRGRKAT